MSSTEPTKNHTLNFVAYGCCCGAILIAAIIGMLALGFMTLTGENDAVITSGDSSFNGNCIDNYIKKKQPTSPLIGFGNVFVSAGKQYNVSPGLIVGITGAESTFAVNWGANYGRITHNPGNVTTSCGSSGSYRKPGNANPRCWKIYSNWDSAIVDLTRLIRENYLNKGLTTPAKIASKYVGPGNHPSWVTTVSKVQRDIEEQCTATGGNAPMATQCTAYPIAGARGSPPYNGSLHGYSVYKPQHVSSHSCFHGWQCSPRCGDAVDVASPRGTSVYAPFSGTCRVTPRNRGTYLENVRIVSDDGSMDATLAHIYAKNCNGHVTAGQPVGAVRPSGWPHLHFELWVNGTPISSSTPGKPLWDKIKAFLSQKPCK